MSDINFYPNMLSTNMQPESTIEKAGKITRLGKLGLGIFLFVGTSTFSIPHSNLSGGVGNTQIKVLNASSDAYNTQTTVYTNNILQNVSEGSEAIQNMRSERPTTVEVNLENAGYTEHTLHFSDGDEYFYEDEEFVLQYENKTAESFSVEAVISSSGYVPHTLEFKDEV